MRFVFFGTGDFAAGLLESMLLKGLVPEAVITTRDRPKGRGRKLAPTPTARIAEKHGLDLVKLRSKNVPVQHLPQAEFYLVSDFGLILKQEVLERPSVACLNLHPSLLPRWRGAAPIVRSIMAGDKPGITVFVMDQGLDTGPIVLQKELELGPWPTAGDVARACFEQGPSMLSEAMEGLSSGRIVPRAQTGPSCYAHKISKDELEPDWSSHAGAVARHINALSPKPGARFSFKDKVFRLLRAQPCPDEGQGTELEPGELRVDKTVIIGCGRGCVLIQEIQAPGKRPLRAEEFARGFRG